MLHALIPGAKGRASLISRHPGAGTCPAPALMCLAHDPIFGKTPRFPPLFMAPRRNADGSPPMPYTHR